MSIPVAVLKYVCVLASSNEGLTAISLAGGPVAGLVARFGSVGILSAIDAWSKPDISEDDLHRAETELGAATHNECPY